MDQDDQRNDPERAWPGLPGAYREHEGGGEIVTGYLVPAIVEESELEPLEGPLDDPWIRGWHAGFVDGQRDAKHRLSMARLDAQRQRREFLLEALIALAVIVVVLAILLSI